MKILSEECILSCIDGYFPNEGGSLLLGRGDDCALLSTSGVLCVSTDIFSEGVHFRPSYFSFEDIGYKALAVNLSDLAAQGARPKAFTLALSVPSYMGVGDIEGLFRGMSLLAKEQGICLAGGDIARAEALHLSVTVMGESVLPLKRGQAQVGDYIFCVGSLGLARAGLLAFEREGRSAKELFPLACGAHLRPFPRVKEGLRLSALALELAQGAGADVELAGFGKLPSEVYGRIGLMDLSDGLLRDLPRLLGDKGLGAELSLGRAAEDVLRYIERYEPETKAHEFMALGGEDYGLLGTCSPKAAVYVMSALAETSLLGRVTADGKISCNGELLGARGFDHFA